MKIGLVSLGCAKNAVDLQVMAGHLVKNGHEIVPGSEYADVILVNTCAFIESAREEAADEILRACELKTSGRAGAVVVAGCLVQRYGKELEKAFPDVDAFLGIDALDRICEVVDKAVHRDAVKSIIPCGAAHKVFDPPSPSLRLTGKAFAYLKIAEGCAHRCAYCAIPAIRGKYRSRKMSSVIEEAKALLSTGVRELNIVAQDPMLYGCDFKDGTTIVSLLREIDSLPGDFWVRVLYSYPSEISCEFIDWMNNSSHAVKYIDVPLQHTDPKVLKAMGRQGAVKATLEAAFKLREAVPGVVLRTTLMTGFPGETTRAFEKMLRDVEKMRFDHLGVFAYSPEEGTPGAEMPGRPLRSTAEKRCRTLMSLQKKIWKKISAKLPGRVFRALVVAPGIARLQSQAPDVDGVTFLLGKRIPSPGEFIDVRIKSVKGYDLEAEIV